jgi:2-oxoglutarate dehydrogenase E2 component (dihydrolipoamide succinyltransferase)
VLGAQLFPEGATVTVSAIIATIETSGTAVAAAPAAAAAPAPVAAAPVTPVALPPRFPPKRPIRLC